MRQRELQTAVAEGPLLGFEEMRDAQGMAGPRLAVPQAIAVFQPALGWGFRSPRLLLVCGVHGVVRGLWGWAVGCRDSRPLASCSKVSFPEILARQTGEADWKRSGAALILLLISS